MVKLIIGAGFTGWAAIIALAYRMAAARVTVCYFADVDCIIRTQATRDGILTVGLTVALVAAIIVALVWTRTVPSPSKWRRSTKPAEPNRLR